MHAFVLGGTGFIGAALARVLIQRGHRLTGLARSETAANKLRSIGGEPLMGDLAGPASWIERLPQVDAVVDLACDLDADMGTVGRRLLDALLQKLGGQRQRPRFITTGGCWLFGATGDDVATEATPFSPLPAFAWMVPHARRILASPAVDGIVIHPAMVYTAAGGVFTRFAEDARAGAAIRVVGNEAVRWPLVHRDDLAELYALALDRAPPGSSYIGAATEGLQVGRIARAFARRFGRPDQAALVISTDQVACELGAWAGGYALDQQLSGAKAKAELGWQPAHLDAEGEIAAMPRLPQLEPTKRDSISTTTGPCQTSGRRSS
jgi:nucleoside-diphosphate-sugar epimerase